MASSSAPLPLPAPPADLAAHVTIAEPRALMPALRDGLGDAIAKWPGSFASLVTTLAELPITSAEVVSDDAPIRASILASESGIDVVAAIHLRAADRLQSIATSGADARFRAVAGEAGLTRLVPVQPREGALRLAVLGNHLLLATSDGALDRAGAFTERAPPPTLRPGELVAIEHGAAAPILARRLATRALASLPSQVLSPLGLDGSGKLPERAETALSALEGGRTTLRLEAGTVRVTVAMGDSVLGRLATASLATSPAASWLALPRDASAAILFHGGGVGSDAIAPSDDLAATLGISGARRDAAGAAMTSLDHARSSAVAVAVGAAPGGPALWFRTPIVDGEGADQALRALVKAFGEKPRKDRPSVTARATVVERVGGVIRLRVRPAGAEDRPPVDVILRHEGEVLLGVAGLDAIGAMQALRDGPGTSRLASDPFAMELARSASAHHVLGMVDLEGLAALARGKGRADKRVLAGASLAEGEGGVLRLLLVADPAALPFLHEKLALP